MNKELIIKEIKNIDYLIKYYEGLIKFYSLTNISCNYEKKLINGLEKKLEDLFKKLNINLEV